MTQPLDPGWLGVCLASLLLLGMLAAAHAGGVHIWKTGLWAALRASVQLIAVGLLLGHVFALDDPLWVCGVLALMVGVASWTAGARIGRQTGALAATLALILGCITAASLLYVTQLVVRAPQWSARYVIPLGGIVLGNAMTAAHLSASHYLQRLVEQRHHVEAALSLGASPRQADQPVFRSAFVTATTPVLNAMLIVGIVKLPGIMSGQMLGGSEPLIAAKYQLVVLFMLAFADGTTALWTLWMLRRRTFSQAWQLRL